MGDPAQPPGLKGRPGCHRDPAAAPPPANSRRSTSTPPASMRRWAAREPRQRGYKFTWPAGHIVVTGMWCTRLRVTTTINFQPVGAGQAAINGDFVMTAPEVQNVIGARAGGIAHRGTANTAHRQPQVVSTCTTGRFRTASPRQNRAHRAGHHQPATRRLTRSASHRRDDLHHIAHRADARSPASRHLIVGMWRLPRERWLDTIAAAVRRGRRRAVAIVGRTAPAQ